jgi:hypothetical protein
VVPEHRPAAVRQNSGEPPAGTGRARAGIDPRVLGGRFLGLVGAGRGPARGAPAASGGGRRDRCAGEGAALWGRRVRRRARVGAREGGSELSLVCSRLDPELAAAAFNGASGRLGRGLAGTQAGQGVRRGPVFNEEGVGTCLQGEGHPPLLAVRRAASAVAPAQGSTARTAGHRGVRPAGEGAGSTWRGRGPQGLGVPPRLGTARPREGASGPDAEAAYDARGRSNALERGQRRGLPNFFRTGTV